MRVVSGGFATVQPNSVLSINAVEGYPLEDFSADLSSNSYVCLEQDINIFTGRKEPDRRGTEDCQRKRQ